MQGITNVHDWVLASTKEACHFSDLELEHGAVIYPAVRCTNGVQLTHTEFADGNIVSYKKPESLMASVEVITSTRATIPESHSEASIQFDYNRIEFQWQGFKDDSGIPEYKARVMQDGQQIETCRTASGIGYCRINYNYQEYTPYFIAIEGVNIGNVISKSINCTVFVSHSQPSLSGKQSQWHCFKMYAPSIGFIHRPCPLLKISQFHKHYT